MFSIQQFFSNSNRLYELLEKAAVEANKCTQLLAASLNSRGGAEISGELAAVHANLGAICANLRKELVRASPAELGREDFESLTQALFKVSKASKKFAGQFSFSSPELHYAKFARHGELMTRASDRVLAMVKQLREQAKFTEIKRINDGLQSIEEEADDLMKEVRDHLFAGSHGELEVLMILDLYQLAEKVINRCTEAGELLIQIALKNQ